MEPMSNVELVRAFALAMWPLWVGLAALAVVRLASHFGFCAPDEYEEAPPCGCESGCCLEAREADAAHRAYLLSDSFCCGEAQVGREACPGCPFERERRYHSDNGWGR